MMLMDNKYGISTSVDVVVCCGTFEIRNSFTSLVVDCKLPNLYKQQFMSGHSTRYVRLACPLVICVSKKNNNNSITSLSDSSENNVK